jgi:hypothetical protein
MPGSNPAEVEIFGTTESMYVFEGGCLRTEGRRVSKDKICLIGKEENMTGGEITKLANSGKQLLKAPFKSRTSIRSAFVQCNATKLDRLSNLPEVTSWNFLPPFHGMVHSYDEATYKVKGVFTQKNMNFVLCDQLCVV